MPDGPRLLIGYAGRYEREGTQKILDLIENSPEWTEFRLALAIKREDQDKVVGKVKPPRTRLVWNLPNAEMPSFYNSVHMFLDPWSFGAPRTSLEALSCGRVVVRLVDEDSSASELPAEVSPALKASTSASLFEGLSQFRDRELLASLGLASRLVAEETYSSQKVSAAYRRVYFELTRSLS
jgi:glycosyltransferase involved in cell wall biosynthesis